MSGKHKLTRKPQEAKVIVLTDADALADLNGTPRPDNPGKKPRKKKANV